MAHIFEKEAKTASLTSKNGVIKLQERRERQPLNSRCALALKRAEDVSLSDET
jgi:hypothetical protein